jgi:hypothetical protein
MRSTHFIQMIRAMIRDALLISCIHFQDAIFGLPLQRRSGRFAPQDPDERAPMHAVLGAACHEDATAEIVADQASAKAPPAPSGR